MQRHQNFLGRIFNPLLFSALIGLGGCVGCTSLLKVQSLPSENQSPTPGQPAGKMDHGQMNPGQMNPGQTDHGQMHPGNMNPGTMQHGNMGHDMNLGPADAEFDLRFIDAMTPHHQGGVDMAKEVLQKSQRPELKQLAQNIIAAQEKEINQMRQWRKTWYPKAPEAAIAWHEMMQHSMPMTPDQIAGMKMTMDLGAADATFDRRFIEAMVPHHQGALVMAQAALAKSKRPEMKVLANAILKSQQGEIDQMNQWKKAWYP